MKKKAITKVLIALVMVALLCALCACGGNSGGSGGSSGGSGSSGSTEKSNQLPTLTLNADGGNITWTVGNNASKIDHYEYIITDADGNEGEVQTVKDRSLRIQEGESVVVRCIPKDENKYKASEWSEPATYAAGIQAQIINLVKGIQSYVDILNDTKADDTLSADVAIGGYFTTVATNKTSSLALSAKANANKTNPSFMIDFKLDNESYVSLGYKDGYILVREPINFVNTDEETANAFKINVASLDPTIKNAMVAVMDMIAGQDIAFSKATAAVEGILNGFGIDLAPLIDYIPEGNKVTLGVKMGLLKTGLQLLPTLQGQLGINIGEEVDKYIGYANKAMEVLGKDPISLNGEALSWNLITAKINAAPEENSLVKIIATYSGKAINKVQLELDLTALGVGFDYKAGLNVDVNTFSTTSTVAISDSGFTAQDIVIDLSAGLGVKGIDADAKAVIRLSDGLAAKGNKLATVTVNATGKDSDAGSAYGYITDSGAYVDLSGIFGMFDVDATSKYKFDFGFSLIDLINGDTASNAAEDVLGEVGAEFGIDIGGFISGITAASDKVEYVCGFVYNNILPIFDESITPKAKAGQADIIEWAFNIELGNTGSYVKNYAKFYNEDIVTFDGLLESIKGIHNDKKDALKAAIFTEAKTAGIQVFAPNGDDLLDYVAGFVRIPSIVDGEPSFAELAEINDAGALIAWLDWIFPATNDARILVEDILGKELDAVINTGLYAEAVGGTGLNGTVLLASGSDKVEEYVSLGGGIDIATSRPATVATIDGATDFDAQEEGSYIFVDAMKALLDALRAYGKAE